MLKFLMLSLVDFLPAGTRKSYFKQSIWERVAGFLR